MSIRTFRKYIAAIGSALLLSSLVACGGGGAESARGDDTSTLNTSTFAAESTVVPATGLSGGAPAKRGVAYGGHSVADMKALSKGVSWWYNWSPSPEAGVAGSYKSIGVEFVPMIWGGNPDVNQLAAAIPDGAKYLLGFNEPNFKAQANKTPSQAASAWWAVEKVAQIKGLQIGAPAVNFCGDCVYENGVTFTDPFVYLDAFFAACQGCRVDFLPVHWYACDVEALKWYIGRMKKYGKPIWLTEFSCGDKPHDQITLAVQKKYMTDAVNYLESEPAVARYSWFSGRDPQIPNINLLGADGQLTELGQLYVSLPGAAGAASTDSTEVEIRPMRAIASTAESDALGPEKAIDKNVDTRWSSAFSDQQWIYFDFGTPVNISRLRINWELAYGKDYQIQMSNDASAWTTVKTVTGGTGGADEIGGLAANGRYLRINGIRRGTGYGYSILEINFWAKQAASTVSETLLSPAYAFASSAESDDLGPDKAVDRNGGTRWSSAFSDEQWILFDFGTPVNISRMRINWEAAYGKDYQIQVSNDAQAWTTVRNVTGGTGGVEEIGGLAANGRFVRINGTKRGTPWGYSMFEVAFWGTPAFVSAYETLLSPRNAVASSFESGNLGVDKAIDKNPGTRWSSAFTDDQWIYFDFVAPVNISRLRINWEAAYGKDYQIQMSDDTIAWTTVKTVTGGLGGVEEIGGLSARGRFLRIKGVKRGSPYGYSMYEITFWGTQSSSPVLEKGLIPRQAVASSSESGALGPDKAIDKNAGTRWSSTFSDQQWIYFDFGAPINISRLRINWEAAYGKDYQIQVSNDASAWTTVKTMTGSLGGVEEIGGLAANGRYVRINGTKRGSGYGYSIFEVAFWEAVTPFVCASVSALPCTP